MAQDVGKVVTLTHRQLFTPWEILVAIVLSEGLCQWKIPMTPSGIEPATFWFVAQHLNHWTFLFPTFISIINNLCWRLSWVLVDFVFIFRFCGQCTREYWIFQIVKRSMENILFTSVQICVPCKGNTFLIVSSFRKAVVAANKVGRFTYGCTSKV